MVSSKVTSDQLCLKRTYRRIYLRLIALLRIRLFLFLIMAFPPRSGFVAPTVAPTEILSIPAPLQIGLRPTDLGKAGSSSFLNSVLDHTIV